MCHLRDTLLLAMHIKCQLVLKHKYPRTVFLGAGCTAIPSSEQELLTWVSVSMMYLIRSSRLSSYIFTQTFTFFRAECTPVELGNVSLGLFTSRCNQHFPFERRDKPSSRVDCSCSNPLLLWLIKGSISHPKNFVRGAGFSCSAFVHHRCRHCGCLS